MSILVNCIDLGRWQQQSDRVLLRWVVGKTDFSKQASNKQPVAELRVLRTTLHAWLILFACLLPVTAHANPSQATADPVRVPFFQIKAQSSFASARRYAGTVVASRSAQLGFKRGGEVANILVDLGVPVKAGQVLARLNDDALVAQEMSAAAQVALSKANLTALKAQVQLAQNTERRLRRLRETGHTSKQTYDEASLAMRARMAELGVAQASISSAQAALQAAQVAVREAAIVAPFDGVIQARMFDEGSQVASGQPVLKLVEQGVLEAHVGLPQDAASALRVGAPYTLVSADRAFAGVLRAVLPEIDPVTRTQTSIFNLSGGEHVAINNRRDEVVKSNTGGQDQAVQHGSAVKGPALAMGSVIELEFAQRVPAQGFWIPLSALSAAERGLWSVFVINTENIVERRLLEVVHTESDRVYARGTLSDADRVVQTGVQRIVPGQTVIPVPGMNASL